MSTTFKLRTQFLGQFAVLATLAIFFFAASGCGEKSNPTASESVSETSAQSRELRATNSPTSAATDTATLASASTADSKATESKATPVVKVSRQDVSFDDAEMAYNSGDYALGSQLFQVYVKEHETNPWGFYMLGLSALKAGETELALTAFNTSLDLDPKHVKSWLNKSRALLDENRFDEALYALEQVFALDAESSVAYRLKGRALHAAGKIEDAADAYRDALRIDDRDVWAMNNLALILMEQEQFELAVPSLARATQIRDDIAYIYNNLGMALERTHRFRDAEEAYAAAVAVDEAHVRAAANLVRIKNVTQDPGIEPVDLDRMAINFIDEIQSWSDENIDRELPITAGQPAGQTPTVNNE
jgi:tetratricopeptide (TPR) repeat protein